MANIFNSDAFWSWARLKNTRIIVFLITRSILRAITSIAELQIKNNIKIGKDDFQNVIFHVLDAVAISYTASLSDSPLRFLDKARVLSGDGAIILGSISDKFDNAPELIWSAGMSAKLYEVERPGSDSKARREFKVRIREILERISSIYSGNEEFWVELARESEIVENNIDLDPVEIVQILNGISLWSPDGARFYYGPWSRLRGFVENCDASWREAWISWFQDRVDGEEISIRRGRKYIYELEFSRILRPFPENLDQDWKVVNPYLIALEEQFRSRSPVIDPLLQSPAPHYFAVANDKIWLSAPQAELSVSESMRDDIWKSLSLSISRFHEQRNGANAHVPYDILEILASLSGNLGNIAGAVRPGSIQSDWRRLKRGIDRLREDQGTGDTRLDVALLHILDALDDFRSCFKDCRAIDVEGIRLGVTARNVDAILIQQQKLALQVESLSDDIVDVAAKAAQNAALRLALAEKDSSVKAELAADQALTNRNLAIVLSNELKDLGRQTWKKSKENVSSELAAAAGWTTKWGLRLLAYKIIVPIIGLSGILEGFSSLAKKFENLAEQGLFDDLQDDAASNAEDELDDESEGRK